LMPGDPQYEIDLAPMSRQAYLAEQSKWLTSSLPTEYYYHPQWPLGFVHLWPLYSGGAVVTLRVYVPAPAPLDGTLTLDTVLDFPAGYFRALRDALALELAPEVGRTVDPLLYKTATDAKAQLERVNLAPDALLMPPALRRHSGAYDWRTDEGA